MGSVTVEDSPYGLQLRDARSGLIRIYNIVVLEGSRPYLDLIPFDPPSDGTHVIELRDEAQINLAYRGFDDTVSELTRLLNGMA